MKEERLCIHSKELDHYLAEAKRLQSLEVARLCALVFRLPLRLFKRPAAQTSVTNQIA